jgi:hypothetical protein
MADNRWYEDDYRRDARRSWAERAGDEVRSWFGDDGALTRRGNDERHDRYPYGGERSWRDQGEGSYRGAQEFSRADWGRDERQLYGRGGQYGYSSYDRGQLRRPSGEWMRRGDTREWNAEPFGGRDIRTGSDWGSSSSGWGHESFAGRGPKGYRRSDERIREDVSDALTADPRVDASEITVQVDTCHVTLTGSVDTRDQKRRAEECAERISGVDDVTNNLRVNRRDYASSHERQDASRLVTPSEVTPDAKNR